MEQIWERERKTREKIECALKLLRHYFVCERCVIIDGIRYVALYRCHGNCHLVNLLSCHYNVMASIEKRMDGKDESECERTTSNNREKSSSSSSIHAKGWMTSKQQIGKCCNRMRWNCGRTQPKTNLICVSFKVSFSPISMYFESMTKEFSWINNIHFALQLTPIVTEGGNSRSDTNNHRPNNTSYGTESNKS